MSLIGGILQGATSLMNTGLSNLWAQKLNREQRDYNWDVFRAENEKEFENWNRQNQYNEGLWNKQNQYNEDLWHKMNAYNSPMAQMERFKEAGLNPNLIYGQNNTTPAIATAQHGRANMKTHGVLPYNPKMGQFDIQSGIQAYMSMRESAARTNNLEAQNKLISEDVQNRAADTAVKLLTGKQANLNYEQSKQLYDTTVQTEIARQNKLRAEADNAMAEVPRGYERHEAQMRIFGQQLRNAKTQEDLNRIKADYDRWYNQMMKEGTNPTDPAPFRWIQRALKEGWNQIKSPANDWKH